MHKYILRFNDIITRVISIIQRNIIQKKKEFYEGGVVSGSKVTYKDYFKEKVDAVKILRDRKNRLFD